VSYRESKCVVKKGGNTQSARHNHTTGITLSGPVHQHTWFAIWGWVYPTRAMQIVGNENLSFLSQLQFHFHRRFSPCSLHFSFLLFLLPLQNAFYSLSLVSRLWPLTLVHADVSLSFKGKGRSSVSFLGCHLTQFLYSFSPSTFVYTRVLFPM